MNAQRLRAEATAADWSGVNAGVTRDFVTKTAAEFQDVAGQATSVLGILRDAGAAFKRHKADLRTVIDDVAKRNIYINAKGGAVASVPSGAAAGSGDIPTPSDEELAVAESRVKRVLREASETDRIAARALRALARNKHDFTGDGPGGIKEADDRQGKADADYWARRVKESDPSEWSAEEIERFNETLISQRDNPGFTSGSPPHWALTAPCSSGGTSPTRGRGRPPRASGPRSSAGSSRTSACPWRPRPMWTARRWTPGRGRSSPRAASSSATRASW
ncbi:hypothetical protein SCALM49S_03195 [Streptomyces californicus]